MKIWEEKNAGSKKELFWGFLHTDRTLQGEYSIFLYFSAPEAHDLEWKRALSSAQSRGTADVAAAILLSLLVNTAQLIA
jgi:hypothetical protein